MTEILRFALVSFYFLFFKSSETLSALLSQNPSPSYSRLMRIILWRKQFSGLLFFSISRLCGLVPGLVWLGQNWNGLNVWACSGNGVHGGFRKGWLCGLGTYIPITFWVTPCPLPFLKDTGVSCFCCSFCVRGSAFIHSDGDVKEFLSVRFQLSCPFLREGECSSKVLLLSVFVSFIHLFTCLLCIIHQTEVSWAHEIGSL